ncbi:hypothetical protein JCM14719A_01320 [Calditerricola satsumensis]|uniref:SLH domain-containing protein n=3 Tax=Calditerricola satsumensis TaxID=373054 RepID=A0A8J3BHC9_9BACI|nr:hypothetical protein GCM10007043_22680 [Calditerricola satsumensis]
MMARATSLLNKPIPSPIQLTFKDAKAIPNWAKDDINKIVSLGFMNGYPDQTFKPYGHGTRAEAAVVIKRFYDWVHQ